MTRPDEIDKRAVRRSFENAAGRYDGAAVLQHEVCGRMLDRLQYIRHDPGMVLDAGSGTGNAVTGLLARFPRARLVVFDLAHNMLQRARARLRWWQTIPGRDTRLHAVCGDLESLPLAAGSVDLIWSNLALQWMNDLPRALREMHRALHPGGLLMFSTFGPDTLKELRAAYAGIDGRAHVSRFVDMHDIGDMLVAGGYADPVMDMERVTLTYDTVRALMHDLKAIGAHNASQARPTGLSGRGLLASVEGNYEVLRRAGRLPATFEIVYGHGWKPDARKSPTGHRVIGIEPVNGER